MEYIPVLILLGVGATIGIVAVTLSGLVGPKIRNKLKESPFECGVPPVGSSRQRVSVRFYLVAILFLLFDVELIFFFPWAVVFKKYLAINDYIIWSMGFFFVILTVGLIYEWKKGALEWD